MTYNSGEQEVNDLLQLRWFLENAPSQFTGNERIRSLELPNHDVVSCIRWDNEYLISGIDILRCIVFRFQAFGRTIVNKAKFEELVFSDLRSLKTNARARLENGKSEMLEFMHRHGCVRTKKKQRVFYWHAVQHDRLFFESLERELRRSVINVPLNDVSRITVSVREPSLSMQFDPMLKVVCQIDAILRHAKPIHRNILLALFGLDRAPTVGVGLTAEIPQDPHLEPGKLNPDFVAITQPQRIIDAREHSLTNDSEQLREETGFRLEPEKVIPLRDRFEHPRLERGGELDSPPILPRDALPTLKASSSSAQMPSSANHNWPLPGSGAPFGTGRPSDASLAPSISRSMGKHSISKKTGSSSTKKASGKSMMIERMPDKSSSVGVVDAYPIPSVISESVDSDSKLPHGTSLPPQFFTDPGSDGFIDPANLPRDTKIRPVVIPRTLSSSSSEASLSVSGGMRSSSYPFMYNPAKNSAFGRSGSSSQGSTTDDGHLDNFHEATPPIPARPRLGSQGSSIGDAAAEQAYASGRGSYAESTSNDTSNARRGSFGSGSFGTNTGMGPSAEGEVVPFPRRRRSSGLSFTGMSASKFSPTLYKYEPYRPPPGEQMPPVEPPPFIARMSDGMLPGNIQPDRISDSASSIHTFSPASATEPGSANASERAASDTVVGDSGSRASTSSEGSVRLASFNQGGDGVRSEITRNDVQLPSITDALPAHAHLEPPHAPAKRASNADR